MILPILLFAVFLAIDIVVKDVADDFITFEIEKENMGLKAERNKSPPFLYLHTLAL